MVCNNGNKKRKIRLTLYEEANNLGYLLCVVFTAYIAKFSNAIVYFF